MGDSLVKLEEFSFIDIYIYREKVSKISSEMNNFRWI